MSFKAKTLAVGSAIGLLLSLSNVTLAERGESRNRGSLGTSLAVAAPAASGIIRLGATLAGASGSTATGAVEYSYSAAGSGAGLLQAKIHLPVDGMTISDSNAAVNDSITLSFYNGSTLIASYVMAISDIDFIYSGTTQTETAEYSLVASDNGSTYTMSLGSGSETALPVLSVADSISVAVGSHAVLSGTLAVTSGF